MTTKFRSVSSLDLFSDNEVYCLKKDHLLTDYQVGGIAWLVGGGGPRTSHKEALSHAVSQTCSRFPNHRLWLLSSHSAWQPDSRMVRFRKLWGSLEARGVEIPGKEVGSSLRESHSGLRFFGIREVVKSEIENIVDVIHHESSSYLVALDPECERMIENLASHGWDVDDFPSPYIMQFVLEHNGILFVLVGDFDDIESGVVAIAQRSIVQFVNQ